MNYDALHFGYEITNPDRLSVYDETTVTLGGVVFELAVIGSSHCVRAPSIGFAEIASCDDRALGDCRTIEIDERRSTTTEYEADAVGCETRISVDPIGRFPDERAFDLRYDFAERAVTAIETRTRGYETWHTYPEHDCAVYTETSFKRLEQADWVGGDRTQDDQSADDRSPEDLASL
jgi:hypothetical protein